jgi:hypothetical protein
MNDDEPFGRQPQPFEIEFTNGEAADKYEWAHLVKRFIEGQGYNTVDLRHVGVDIHLKVYPGAVND